MTNEKRGETGVDGEPAETADVDENNTEIVLETAGCEK
jgi:hypothetical protein